MQNSKLLQKICVGLPMVIDEGFAEGKQRTAYSKIMKRIFPVPKIIYKEYTVLFR